MSNVLWAKKHEVLALGKRGHLKFLLEDEDGLAFTIASGTFDLIRKDGTGTKLVDGNALNVLVGGKGVEGFVLAAQATEAGEFLAHYDLVLASSEEQVVLQKVSIKDTEATATVP